MLNGSILQQIQFRRFMWIKIILLGLIIRVALIEYFATTENFYEGVLGYFSDVDYKVYLDASLYQSPYQKHTYRYSPILSIIASPSYEVHQTFGKLVLAFFDALAIFFIYNIYADRQSKTKDQNKNIATIQGLMYCLNPVLIYLSIRGSCQSITVTLMFAFWYFYFGQNTHGNMSAFERRDKGIVERQPNTIRKYISYIIFGLWVHFRVFPIILVPLLIMHEYHSVKQNKIKHTLKFIVEFGLVAGGVFVALAAYFYYLYGYDFLHQTYFYHLTRRDNRHSCSAFFYQIFLNYETDSASGALSRSVSRMLPSVIALFAASFVFVKHYSLFFCHAIIVSFFVIFNRVITAQYYMWLFCALYLVHAQIQGFKQKKWLKTFITSVFLPHLIAIPPVLLWQIIAKKVELQVKNYHLYHIWYSTIFLMFCHTVAYIKYIRHIKPYSKENNLKAALENAKQMLAGKKQK